jgi:hypothetical protein
MIMPRGKGKRFEDTIISDDKQTADKVVDDKTEPETPENKIYIFRSLYDMGKIVQSSRYINHSDGHGGTKRITDPNQPPVKITFVNCNFVLNQAFADEYNMTVDEVAELIFEYPDYNKDFICTSGPGIKIDHARVKRFMVASDNAIKVKQGAI